MNARRPRPGHLAPVAHADTLARLRAAIRAGDTAAEHAARWALTMTVRGLIYRQVHHHNASAEDIGSALMLRVAENVHKWNPRRGALSTFTRAVIMSALSDGRELRAIVGPVVTVPCVRRRLVRLAARDGTASAAAQVNRTEECARRMLAVSQTHVDAAAPSALPGRPFLLHEVIADDRQDAERAIFTADRAHTLRRAIGLLSDRQADIVRRFYGIGQAQESATDIGNDYGVSRQRIDQILSSARAALRTTLPDPEIL